METGRNLVLLFVSDTSERVFYPNSTISVPSKTHTCSPQAWKPEATMDTSQDGGACSSPTGTRDQGTFFLLLRGWYRMGLFIPLWPKIGFSYLNGAARLLHFRKTCFPSCFNPEELVPSCSYVGSSPSKTKDAVVSWRERGSCLRLAWLSVANGSCSSICRYQDHHSEASCGKGGCSWFCLPGMPYSLPVTLFPILSSSAVLVPSFSRVGPPCSGGRCCMAC